MKNVKNIVIVGGGFAGWYTAVSFLNNFPTCKIKIIDSDKIPRLGVGETLGYSSPYDWKKHLNVDDDSELMRKTGAIYKFGVSTKNFWSDNSNISYGKFFNLKIKSLLNFYNQYNYDDFFEPRFSTKDDFGLHDAWMYINKHTDKSFKEYSNEILESNFFIDNPVAPYSNEKYILRNAEGWSYHIDAEQTVTYLQQLAKNKSNCSHIKKEVVDCQLNKNGIEYLILEDNSKVYGDLFLDCSGFKRILSTKVKNNSWEDEGSEFCDSAWVCPTRYTNPEKEIIGGTEITGENHGWRFNVRLYHRSGNGYIFNSNITNDELPLQELLNSTNNRIKEPRLIKWNPGHYTEPWYKNVIAMGISSSFIDPFDAPTFDIHSRSLDDYISVKDLDIDSARNEFNKKQMIVQKERKLRLIFNFGLNKKQGEFWESRRQIVKNNDLYKELENIVNGTSDIYSYHTHSWNQMYYRMIVASNEDRKQFNFLKPTENDIEMAKSFFTYNASRNKYIETVEWPNYYTWLRKNKFDNKSSEEILYEFHPELA